MRRHHTRGHLSSTLWQIFVVIVLITMMIINVKRVEKGRRPLRRSASSSQEPTYLVRSLSEVACCPLEALIFLLLHAGLRGIGIIWAGVQESKWEGVWAGAEIDGLMSGYNMTLVFLLIKRGLC